MLERKIVYIDGVFDLTHYGHLELIKKIKELIPHSFILVGISKDDDVANYKKKSILKQVEKYKLLENCKYIDKILLDIPWIIDNTFIEKHNIDYVCHDPRPYNSDGKEDIYKFCKKKGIFLGINRTPNISTTDIINRVLAEYS